MLKIINIKDLMKKLIKHPEIINTTQLLISRHPHNRNSNNSNNSIIYLPITRIPLNKCPNLIKIYQI